MLLITAREEWASLCWAVWLWHCHNNLKKVYFGKYPHKLKLSMHMPQSGLCHYMYTSGTLHILATLPPGNILLPTEQKAWWVSELIWTTWGREKSVASARNQTMIPWLSSLQKYLQHRRYLYHNMLMLEYDTIKNSKICITIFFPNSIPTTILCFYFHIRTVHHDIIKVFYSPTNAQVIVVKTILKFTLK